MIGGVLSVLSEITKVVRSATLSQQFGFVQSHAYLEASQLDQLKLLLDSDDDEYRRSVVSEFETAFARLVGAGFSSSFASARMAFYTVMKVFGIREGDEVILPAFTCSVMPNAILRLGAQPVYADIDTNTLGSSAVAIRNAITSRTKLIVAQHSFGIPCEIDQIVNLAREKGIRVVEDCAIALDSSLNGIVVGNWGDAAIFSTDHSKPLNTILGGILYTRDHELHEKVQELARANPSLSREHQRRLHHTMRFEGRRYIPNRYPRAMLSGRIFSAGARFLGSKRTTFLEGDYTIPTQDKKDYPYPAAMPPFLALLGLYELERWQQESARRKEMLSRFTEMFQKRGLERFLPLAYMDPSRNITPLRFAFLWPDSDAMIHKLSACIDTDWIWFRKPIVGVVDGMECLFYQSGSCPTSERICNMIINFPCAVADGWEAELLQLTEHILAKEADRLE